MPSISIANCAGDSIAMPPGSIIRGHTKRLGFHGPQPRNGGICVFVPVSAMKTKRHGSMRL